MTDTLDMFWLLEEAVKLCRDIEKLVPAYGAHVALTGGCLFQNGKRKDVDLVFYRIRQVERVDTQGLIKALHTLGIEVLDDHGFCIKAFRDDRMIDMFFPERPREEWPTDINSEYS